MKDIKIKIILILSILNIHFAFAESNNIQKDNIITFSVELIKEVENDTYEATIFTTHQAKQSKLAINLVNKDISWAINKLKNIDDLEIQMLSYNTAPIYDIRDKTNNYAKIISWQVQQSVVVRSKDKMNIIDALNIVSKKLAVNNIRQTLSFNAKQKIQFNMLAKAINLYREKAQKITESFNFKSYTIQKINVDQGNNQPQYRMTHAEPMMRESSNSSIQILQRKVKIRTNIYGSIKLIK